MTERIHELIAQLASFEQNPRPVMLREILAEGEAAVPPLLALLEQDSLSQGAERFAVLLLARLGAAEVLPHLLRLFDSRTFSFDALLYAFLDLGPAGWPALRERITADGDWYERGRDLNLASWFAVYLSRRYPELRQEIDTTLADRLRQLVVELPESTGDRQTDITLFLDDLVENLAVHPGTEIQLLLEAAAELDYPRWGNRLFDIHFGRAGWRSDDYYRHNEDWLAVYSETYAGALVAELQRLEEWPEPYLLDFILAQGETAVPPLLKALRRRTTHLSTRCWIVRLLGRLGAIEAARDVAAQLPQAWRSVSRPLEQGLVDAFLELGPAAWPTLREKLYESPEFGNKREERHLSGFWVAVNLAQRYPELQPEVSETFQDLLTAYLAGGIEWEGENEESGNFLLQSLYAMLLQVDRLAAEPLLGAMDPADPRVPLLKAGEQINQMLYRSPAFYRVDNDWLSEYRIFFHEQFWTPE